MRTGRGGGEAYTYANKQTHKHAQRNINRQTRERESDTQKHIKVTQRRTSDTQKYTETHPSIDLMTQR